MAALLVVMFHNALYIFAKGKYWGYDPAQGFFDFSHAGVEFFFVLSGFIILHVHWMDLERPSAFSLFVKKRFLRLYPLYWLVLAIVIPVYFVVPSFGKDYNRDPGIMLSSALLVFFKEDHITELPIAWTLYHEVLFYFFFSLAILHKRFGLAVLCIWFSASAASLFLKPTLFPIDFITSHLHPLFGMGMAICWLVRNERIKAPGLWLSTGLVLFAAAGLEEDYASLLKEDIRDLAYGLASAFILAGMVELENRNRLRVYKVLQLIGNASYSIYLTHFTVLSLLAKIFIRLGAREMFPAFIPYALLPVLTVLFGIALHLLIEKPLLRIIGRGFSPNRPMLPQAA